MFSEHILNRCKNAYIPSPRYFPNFGQLGCSGFVLIKNNKFISKKTKGFLDHGEAAFADVERLLGVVPPESSSTTTAIATTTTLPTAPATKTVRRIEDLPKTGIADMDMEHQECTLVLNRLLQSNTIQNLQRAVNVLTEHFAHEEEILAEKFGSDVSPDFSPLQSHTKDHQRILQIGQTELRRLQAAM